MSSSFTSGPVTAYMQYYCRVSDDYGNNQDVWFDLYVDNQFRARADGNTSIYVDLGGSAVMRVIPSGLDLSKLSYQWRRLVWDPDSDGYFWEPIEGAVSDSYTATDVNSLQRYSCELMDGYGNCDIVEFMVIVSNGFHCDPVGDGVLYVPAGQTATMAVNAHFDLGEVHYQWYESVEVVDEESGNSWEEFRPIEGAVSSSFLQRHRRLRQHAGHLV